MKVYSQGRIAYHVIRLNEDGSSTFVQYGLDGEVESETPYSPDFPVTTSDS